MGENIPASRRERHNNDHCMAALGKMQKLSSSCRVTSLTLNLKGEEMHYGFLYSHAWREGPNSS